MIDDSTEPDPATVMLAAEQIRDTEATPDFMDCDPVVREVFLAVDRFEVNLEYKILALESCLQTLYATVEIEGKLAERGDWQMTAGGLLMQVRDVKASCFYGERGSN